MVYDATCVGRLIGLTHVWRLGGGFYRTLRHLDASFGATTWSEALRWLSEHGSEDTLAEVQFWGHGKWGAAKIGGEALSVASLRAGHAHRPLLDAVAARMTPASLFWFRTCETFGAVPGQRFARELTDQLGCAAAGHTFIISHWQSGLHRLAPGEIPHWPLEEGLREGTVDAPRRALWSRAWAPNTISCLRSSVPAGF